MPLPKGDVHKRKEVVQVGGWAGGRVGGWVGELSLWVPCLLLACILLGCPFLLTP